MSKPKKHSKKRSSGGMSVAGLNPADFAPIPKAKFGASVRKGALSKPAK